MANNGTTNKARKVFISVLGAGYYGECRYCRGELDSVTGKYKFESTNTRFVQQATLEYLNVVEDWKENDVILIALTKKARIDNWEVVDNDGNNRRMNPRTQQKEDYIGLKQIISRMKLKCKVEEVDIPDGKDETEMWEVFSNLYEKFEVGDEFYIDLTHSFRYLPMLLLVLSNYSKTLKKVSVRHISYGNYEARDQSVIPNKAQLMDILPLSKLQDWTYAATDLIKNGNANRLVSLSNSNSLTPFLRSMGKNSEERKPIEDSFNGYVKALQKLISDLKLCQGPDLLNGTSIYDYAEQYNKVKKLLPQYIKDPSKKNKGVISPIPPIIENIHQTFSDWETTATNKETIITKDGKKKKEEIKWTWKTDKEKIGIRNGYKAAKWCYDYQLYQQAITILRENITTELCVIMELDYTKRKNRDYASGIITGYNSGELKGDVKCFRDIFNQIVNEVKDIRDAYNHACMDKTLNSDSIDKIGKLIETCLKRTDGL